MVERGGAWLLQDCILRLLSSTNAAVYTSGPPEGTPPCQLTVSSEGGGFIRVTASAFTLFVQPRNFGVLLDGGFAQDAPFGDVVGYNYQIYDTSTATVSQIARTSTQLQGSRHTYLPVSNSVLACEETSDFIPANITAGCEVFSAAARTWTPTGHLSTRNRQRFAMVTLNDGAALLVGGRGGYGNTLLASTELYYPPSGVWTPIGSLAVGRQDVQLAKLPTGEVVAAGGTTGGDLAYEVGGTSTEVFHPSTNSWTTASPMAMARTFHQLVTLQDGRVLAVGGANGTFFFDPIHPITSSGRDNILGSCEIFDPASGTWTPTGSLATSRYLHRATLLASGRVLVTGGMANGTAVGQATVDLASSEIFDPVSGSWTPGPDMPEARSRHEQITLPSGQVFVTGGRGPDYLSSSLLYNEGAGTWSATGSLVSLDLISDGVLFRG